MIKTLSNSGTISGGAGGSAGGILPPNIFGGVGGAGVSNSAGATIGLLDNKKGAPISGGAAGSQTFAGPGVLNVGTITTLTNAGAIEGASAEVDSDGVLNKDLISTLNNSGSVVGGSGAVGIGASGVLDDFASRSRR
jgi:hypothetical protein